jgi:hypothetical protein
MIGPGAEDDREARTGCISAASRLTDVIAAEPAAIERLATIDPIFRDLPALATSASPLGPTLREAAERVGVPVAALLAVITGEAPAACLAADRVEKDRSATDLAQPFSGRRISAGRGSGCCRNASRCGSSVPLLQRILPFLASMHTARAAGRTAAPTKLTDDRPLAIHRYCHFVAVATVALGIAFAIPSVVLVGAVSGAVGALAFAWFAISVFSRMRTYLRAPPVTERGRA